jgi:hypothetical protein
MENSDFINLEYTGDFSLVKSVKMSAKSAFANDISTDKKLNLAILIENSWKSVGVQITQNGKKLVAQIFDIPSNTTNSVYSCESEPPILAKVNHCG